MKTEDLIINNFQKGIADSEHLGFADMRNLDISSVRGVAKINWSTSKVSGTTIISTPQWFTVDTANQVIYCIDDTSRVYKSTDSGNTWALVSGNTVGNAGVGLAVWKDYLFAFRNSAVDVYGPLSGSPSWSNSWATYTASNVKPAIVGQDDILYFGNGRYVGSIAEASGSVFAPGNPATYNYNASALTLPANYNVNCFAELGINLMIGTYKGAVLNVDKTADIFPWDRSSTGFRLPLRIKDFGVNQMISINNTLYFMTGTEGSLYATNGASIQFLRKLSQPMQHSSVQQDTYGPVDLQGYPGAMMQHKNKLYFGVSRFANTYIGPEGVWSLDLQTNVLNFEHQISTGNAVSAVGVRIGCLYSVDNESYLIGWSDLNTSAKGIDKVITTARYTNYAAYLDTEMYKVGTPNFPRTFKQMDIMLTKPLATGQGVKVSYRTNSAASFTTLATFDYATYGAKLSFNFMVPLDLLQQIQFRIALTTGSSSTTTPELEQIILR